MKLFRCCSLFAVTLTLIAGCADDASDEPGGAGGAGGQAGGGAVAGSGAGRSPQAGAGGQGTAGAAGKAGAAGTAGVAGGGGSSAGSGGAAPGGAGGEGGSDSGEGLIETCLDADVIDDVRTEALTLKGDGVEVGIVRRVDPDGVGTSGTTVWLPQRLGIVRGALAQCVTTLADLTYTISHHNFDDMMTAKVEGQTLHVSLTRVDYSSPTSWTVTGKQGDTVSWGPLALTLEGCTRLDSGENCLPNYE